MGYYKEHYHSTIIHEVMNPTTLVEGFPAPDRRIIANDGYEMISEIRCISPDFSVKDYSKEMEKIGWEHVNTTYDKNEIILTYRKEK